MKKDKDTEKGQKEGSGTFGQVSGSFVSMFHGAAAFAGKITGLFQRREIARLLSELEIFSRLDGHSLVQLAKRVEEESFEEGTKILSQGDIGDRMYILVEGQVTIPVTEKISGRPLTVQLSAGNIFGELALLMDKPRIADVLAATDCRCLVLRKETVDLLLMEYPDAAKFLTMILGKRLLRSGEIRQIGKYKFMGLLGKHETSRVYESKHPEYQKPVIVKVLSHDKVFRAAFREKFRQEAKRLTRLRHPNIVTLFDVEEAYETFFLAMEKCEGSDLERRLMMPEKLHFGEVRRIIKEMAGALDFAHSFGIIHQGIKPSSVLFDVDGISKLADFGVALATAVDENPETSLDGMYFVQGAPEYIAPEQVRGQKPDGRADIYSLGIVAFQMLLGRTPFVGPKHELFLHQLSSPVPDPRSFSPDIPHDLADFVLRATAKEPADRFQSCTEILSFFKEYDPDVLEHSALEHVKLTYSFHPTQRDVVENLVKEAIKNTELFGDIQVRREG